MKRIVLGEGVLSLTWKFGSQDPPNSLVGLWDPRSSATRKPLIAAIPFYSDRKIVRLIVEEVRPSRQPADKKGRK